MSSRFIVEADGGSRGNPGPAGYGALVRDADTGTVLTQVAEAIGVASNNVAEYRGLIAGLHAAVGLDPDAQIDVRMDSKLVVEQMSGRWKIKHEDMRRLAVEAREVVNPGQVRYTWIPRASNGDADRLANEAMDQAAQGKVWSGGRRPDAAGVTTPVGQVAEPSLIQSSTRPAATPAGAPDIGKPVELVLLRHGVTELTLERRFSGWGGVDPALTDQGRQQAQAAAKTLAAEDFVAVISSPLLRTRQTAGIVAERLGLPVQVEQGWAECAFGHWDGHTSREVAQRWPTEHQTWLSSTAVAPPGGESFEVMDARVLLARDRIVTQYPRGRILVVTHASPIKVTVSAALGVGLAAIRRMDSAPASITRTRWWTDGASIVVSYNGITHLDVG